MPKATKSPGVQGGQRHNPLTEDYVPSQNFKQKAAKRRKQSRDEDEEHYVDSKASKRILQIGRELAEEDEVASQVSRPAPANPAFDFSARLGEDQSDEEPAAQYDDDEAWGDEEEVVMDEEVSLGLSIH